MAWHASESIPPAAPGLAWIVSTKTPRNRWHNNA